MNVDSFVSFVLCSTNSCECRCRHGFTDNDYGPFGTTIPFDRQMATNGHKWVFAHFWWHRTTYKVSVECWRLELTFSDYYLLNILIWLYIHVSAQSADAQSYLCSWNFRAIYNFFVVFTYPALCQTKSKYILPTRTTDIWIRVSSACQPEYVLSAYVCQFIGRETPCYSCIWIGAIFNFFNFSSVEQLNCFCKLPNRVRRITTELYMYVSMKIAMSIVQLNDYYLRWERQCTMYTQLLTKNQTQSSEHVV